KIDGAGTCRFLPVLDRDRFPELSPRDQLAVLIDADLSGNEEQRSCAYIADIVCDRGRWGGKDDAEISKFLFDLGHDGAPSAPRHALIRTVLADRSWIFKHASSGGCCSFVSSVLSCVGRAASGIIFMRIGKVLSMTAAVLVG